MIEAAGTSNRAAATLAVAVLFVAVGEAEESVSGIKLAWPLFAKQAPAFKRRRKESILRSLSLSISPALALGRRRRRFMIQPADIGDINITLPITTAAAASERPRRLANFLLFFKAIVVISLLLCARRRRRGSLLLSLFLPPVHQLPATLVLARAKPHDS